MINSIYQLIAPKVISVKFDELADDCKQVLVKPTHLALCHADQRYYRGLRDKSVLSAKLPMALIHEAVGTVVRDPKGQFAPGEQVIMIPNIPGDGPDCVEENYQKGSRFRSSGFDGFMQEYVQLPHDRLVKADGINPEVAAIAEFISIAMHSTKRFERKAVTDKNVIGIWGDGNLGYVVSFVLKSRYPDAKIVVIGQNQTKLQYFSFADETYLDFQVPDDFAVDHAFECTGGEGCQAAINNIIRYINPEGMIMLLGVSENNVPIRTRDVLEKGLTMVGSSRSSREDFENVAKFLQKKKIERRFRTIISDVIEVRGVDDINRAFESDINNPFKTVMKWNI